MNVSRLLFVLLILLVVCSFLAEGGKKNGKKRKKNRKKGGNRKNGNKKNGNKKTKMMAGCKFYTCNIFNAVNILFVYFPNVHVYQVPTNCYIKAFRTRKEKI